MKSHDMSLSDDSHDTSLAHGKGSSQDKCSSRMVEQVKSWYSSRLWEKEGTTKKSSQDKEIIDLLDDDEVMDNVCKSSQDKEIIDLLDDDEVMDNVCNNLKEAEQYYFDYIWQFPDAKLP